MHYLGHSNDGNREGLIMFENLAYRMGGGRLKDSVSQAKLPVG